jgi:hypothetical protein
MGDQLDERRTKRSHCAASGRARQIQVVDSPAAATAAHTAHGREETRHHDPLRVNDPDVCLWLPIWIIAAIDGRRRIEYRR